MSSIKYLRKNISIPEDLLIELRERKLTEGFNYSSWCVEAYYKEFATTEHLTRIRLKHNESTKVIDKLIKSTTHRCTEQEFTEEEQTYIKRIPILLKAGKNIEAITKRFNINYKKKLTAIQLKNMISKLTNANSKK